MFNQSLEWWQSQVEAGVKPTKRLLLDWFLTVLRPANPWIGDVTSRAARNAWDDLEIAFKRFFKNVKAGKQNGSKKNLYGYPQFKKKGLCDSFSVREKEKFDVDGRTIRIEKLSTRIKMRQTLRFTGLPKQVTIRYRAGKWFASILIEVIATPWKLSPTRQPSVGVDLGSKRLATLSTGEIIPATAALQRQLKKLKRVQRQMAKKQKGSTCSAALKLKLGKLHYYIKRQRQEELHQLTDYLTQNFDVITIEDLNVQGMVQNHCLARAINDAGFYEFRRQLEYKAYFRGNTLVIANRWFPSSKLCSACGTVNTELTLADREWQCACGQCHDRDLLAACNLNQYGLDTLQPDLKCA